MTSDELLKVILDFIKVKSLICEDEIAEIYREDPDRTNKLLDLILDKVRTGVIDAGLRKVIFCCFCKHWDRTSLRTDCGEAEVRKCLTDPEGKTWTASDFFCGEAEDDMSDVMFESDIPEEEIEDDII